MHGIGPPTRPPRRGAYVDSGARNAQPPPAPGVVNLSCWGPRHASPAMDEATGYGFRGVSHRLPISLGGVAGPAWLRVKVSGPSPRVFTNTTMT